MRYNEIRTVEAVVFTSATDAKYFDTVNGLIDQGQTFALGQRGDAGTFVVNKGTVITSNTQWLDGQGTLNGEEVKKIKANQLFKSPQIINLQRGLDADAVTSTSQKETHVVKPSQIFKDEKFSATQVFNEVIQNNVLQQSEIGVEIIKMAQQISTGDLPQFKQLPPAFKPAIRDYAGEYLGVLALIKNIADFPTRKQWFEHLGVNALDDIMIYFPPEQNNPLGDSEGYFQNAATGNMILISSKGGKKGAPPSLTGLKIPDNLRTPEYNDDIEIIETLQNTSGIMQPFVGINMLFDNQRQDSIPEVARNAGRVSDDDIAQLQSLMDVNKYSKKDYTRVLPEKFVNIVNAYADLKKVNERATPGGIVHYCYNKILIEAVNINKALPNFEPLAREILQQNFIQIFARPKGSVLGFDVLWPNREMATGKIELATKSSSTEPGKGKLSFSVT